MAVLLLSLTGIPPTVGFFAKLYVLLATVDADLGWLAVAIALNAALAAFYYLRVIVYMYMRDPEADPAPIDRHPLVNAALALSVAGVLLLGLFPEPILGCCELPPAPSSEPMSPRQRGERLLAGAARRLLGDRRLLIATNRGPVTFSLGADGGLRPRRGSGGLVTALSQVGQHVPVTWLAAPFSDGDRLGIRQAIADRPGAPR